MDSIAIRDFWKKKRNGINEKSKEDKKITLVKNKNDEYSKLLPFVDIFNLYDFFKDKNPSILELMDFDDIIKTPNVSINYSGFSSQEDSLKNDYFNYILSRQKNLKQILNKHCYDFISGDKWLFYNFFKDKKWMIKTISIDDLSSIDDIPNLLKFPIICKKTKGHSGKGILKIDTIKELKDMYPITKDPFYDLIGIKKDFDIIYECKEIKKEFRVFLFRNKIIEIDERIKEDGSTGIGGKSKDDVTQFEYVEQDKNNILDKLPLINDIRNDILEKIKFDFWALDILVDNHNKLFVIEVNSNIGMGIEKIKKIIGIDYDE